MGKCVNLIGYSFGGRVVYAALKELVRLQLIWDEKGLDVGGEGETQRRAIITNLLLTLVAELNTIENSDGTSTLLAREPRSIVSNVVLMGTPTHVKRSKWSEIRNIVNGRIINCHSNKDVVLKYLFQYRRKLGSVGSAGEVVGCGGVGVEGVEDWDCGEEVNDHNDWGKKVRVIISKVGDLA